MSCCPFRHQVSSGWSRKLSCPSPAQSHNVKFFPFSFVSFHIRSSHSTLNLPLPRIPWTLISHKCLCFLLLSILIRCPNHLCSFLSTISVTGTSINIPQIWLFLILSLLVFLKYKGRSEMTASYCIMLVHNVEVEVGARSFPRMLTQEHKEHCMQVCRDLLNQYKTEGDSFLDHIIIKKSFWDLFIFHSRNKTHPSRARN